MPFHYGHRPIKADTKLKLRGEGIFKHDENTEARSQSRTQSRPVSVHAGLDPTVLAKKVTKCKYFYLHYCVIHT